MPANDDFGCPRGPSALGNPANSSAFGYRSKSIVDDILKNIVDAAASGDEVSLQIQGKFKVKATPEREGRNPASGEKIKIAVSKKLTFSSAKSVKDLLNG